MSSSSAPVHSPCGRQPPPSRLRRGGAAVPIAASCRNPHHRAPVIDGMLDERVWQQATPIDDFVQTEPTEGQPATERTEVRILYDDTALYIGVICLRQRSGAHRHHRLAARFGADAARTRSR